MSAPFVVKALTASHDRARFLSGEDPLDRYFQTQVTQDVRRRVAACFAAIEARTGEIAAYYTLSSASIPLADVPIELSKRLPRYPSIPAVLVGRLAVDLRFQGRGLGGALLADALDRVLSSAPAAYALLVDAKHDRAVAFYRHHGFLPLIRRPRTLFLPIATARRIAGAAGSSKR